MRSIRYLSIVILFSFLVFPESSAQKEYETLSVEQGLEFSYLWKRSKVLKKDSPMILYLKINNSNDYNASVEFTLDYFWNGVRSASSEPITRCIKAGKKIKGKIKGLTFEKAGYSDQDINSVSLEIDVSEVTVNKVDKCKMRN